MAEKGHIAGFADTGQDDEDLFEDAGGARYAERPLMHAASDERREADKSRRQNDYLVDRKLNALHRHGLGMDERLSELVDVVGKLAGSVSSMQTDQAKNNEMTEKILVITSGGKFLVGMIKLFGVLAVPLTALYTLYYVMVHGGQPPHVP